MNNEGLDIMMWGEKVAPSDEHSTVREGWVLNNNSTFSESQGPREGPMFTQLCLHYGDRCLSS